MIREGVCTKENLVSINQKSSTCCKGGYDFKEKESVYVYEGGIESELYK